MSNIKRRISFLIIGILILALSAWSMSQSSGDSSVDAKAQKNNVYLGVFREGAPANMNYIEKFVEEVGKKPATIMWYQDWAQTFPAVDAQKVADYGAVPHIVWEARYWTYPGKVKIDDILVGKWDNYIRSWARAVKTFGKPIFLRVGHEFNIEIYPWGVVNLKKNPETFVQFYKHIVDIFKQEKVNNIQWVWCFNNYSNPDESWNNWVKAYPGDKYVDWIGIDGYNWGKTHEWSGWEDLKGLFRNQMRLSRKLWPTKPIMLAEFSSTENGGNKAAWIRELPDYLKTSMREINAIIWFDIKKEADWRVKSSPASLAAFKEIMKDPIFSSYGEALAGLSVSGKQAAKKKLIAAKTNKIINMDADLGDWRDSQAAEMKDASYFKEGINWGGTKDLSGQFYVQWDETNFYLAANIIDSNPLVNTKTLQDIWNGDAVEVVLSLDPQADPKRSSFAKKDYQIGFSTGDGKGNQAIIWNWQRRREPAGSKIVVKRTADPAGYVLEAMIPWKSFSESFVPQEGTKLGFDLAFDDADSAGAREKQLIWNGDYYFYKDPSVWGTLELE